LCFLFIITSSMKCVKVQKRPYWLRIWTSEILSNLSPIMARLLYPYGWHIKSFRGIMRFSKPARDIPFLVLREEKSKGRNDAWNDIVRIVPME
jgi:hypothetical protein